MAIREVVERGYDWLSKVELVETGKSFFGGEGGGRERNQHCLEGEGIYFIKYS